MDNDISIHGYDKPAKPLYCTVEDHRLLRKYGLSSCPKCGGNTDTWQGPKLGELLDERELWEVKNWVNQGPKK